MLKRFLTGIVIVLLTIGFLALRFVSPYFFDIFILAISVFGTLEVCNVYEKSQKQNDKFFIISYPFAVLITLSISLHYKLSALIYFSIIILEALVYILAMYIKNLTTKKTLNREMIESSYSGSLKQYISNKLSLDCFLLFYPAFLLCLMFFLNHIEGFLLAGDGNVLVGLLLLLMLFATTMFTDTGAYLIGSGLKGKKLCPKISPNNKWGNWWVDMWRFCRFAGLLHFKLYTKLRRNIYTIQIKILDVFSLWFCCITC